MLHSIRGCIPMGFHVYGCLRSYLFLEFPIVVAKVVVAEIAFMLQRLVSKVGIA